MLTEYRSFCLSKAASISQAGNFSVRDKVRDVGLLRRYEESALHVGKEDNV
jgi:hypothetical protein